MRSRGGRTPAGEEAIAARIERDVERGHALGAGGRLHQHVGRSRRVAHTKERVGEAPQRRVRLEGGLDGAIEVKLVGDVAELAVRVGPDLIEPAGLFRCRQAARAYEPPAHLEEACRNPAQERA